MKHFPKIVLIFLAGGMLFLTSCASAKMCGSEKYSEHNQFCYNDKVYDKCYELNDKNIVVRSWSYDPATENCLMKCGSSEYNRETQFCSDAKVYDKCGEKGYSPSIQVCSDNIVLTKCDSSFYDYSTHYCKSGTTPTAYSTFKDDRDGKTYKYVTIGKQTWMAENLAYTEKILLGEIGTCPYNKEAYCSFGRLYTWNNAKNVCPKGWHLPNAEEWTELITFVGGEKEAGKHLKARLGWTGNNGNFTDYNGTGLDSYGFRAYPSYCNLVRSPVVGGSIRFSDAEEPICHVHGSNAVWLNASAIEKSDVFRGVNMGNMPRIAILFAVSSNLESISVKKSDIQENNEFSVRCVKD